MGEETPSPAASKLKGLNKRLALAISACALGSAFQHGYNTGVVNAPQELVQEFINATNHKRTGEYVTLAQVKLIYSWIAAIFCIGGMIGGSVIGIVSDRFGRKGGLLLNNVLVIIAVILQGFSKMAGSYEMVIAGRFFIGLNSGLNAGLAPMYLAEISPVNLRGAVGTVYQLVITISILLSQVLGLDFLFGTESRWPWLFAFTGIAAIFQLATLPFCPESPKFLLLNRGKEIEAQKALTWLRETIEVHDEMDEMRNEYESMKLVPTTTLKEMFMNPMLRGPLIISVMMMLAQQLSGINAVIFYSTSIFTEDAGLDKLTASYATIGMGAMNVCMTVISLVLVERAGRKTLQLIGLTGMGIDLILLFLCLRFKEDAPGLKYVSIIFVILFVVMFATGPGSIPWFLVTELFHQGSRPMATSIAVAVNWTANFLVGLGFPSLQLAIQEYVFLMFAGLLSLFILFTWRKVPETKGKSIDEITAMFRQKTYS